VAREPPKCAHLLVEEVINVCNKVLQYPLAHPIYAVVDDIEIRRSLMARTEQHLYYSADVEAGLVTVMRIWGARRGRGPQL
jgi:hypothetical protein